jgi:PAS domain-containing protein
MTVLKWILDNKDSIGWIAGSIFATYKFFILFYKKGWLPFKKWFDNIKYQLNNNGGKSLLDIIQKMDKNITSIKVRQEADFQLNPDCKFECAPDGRWIKVNDALCRLFGATDRQRLMGYSWVNFVKHNEQEQVRQHYDDGVETDNVITDTCTITNGVTNTDVSCSYTAYVKRDSETNEIINIFGIVTKI